MVLNLVKKIIYKIYHDFIVWGYKRYGMMYGDELSYSFMGECVNSVENYYKFFASRYDRLGYAPISLNDWEIAGRYRGENHIKHMLLKGK